MGGLLQEDAVRVLWRCCTGVLAICGIPGFSGFF